MKKTIIIIATVLLFGITATARADTQITENLHYGMTDNPQVVLLQQDLNRLTPLPITGNFYGKTLAAVKQFQGEHSLPTTGFVGSLTRAILNYYFNQPPVVVVPVPQQSASSSEAEAQFLSSPVIQQAVNNPTTSPALAATTSAQLQAYEGVAVGSSPAPAVPPSNTNQYGAYYLDSYVYSQGLENNPSTAFQLTSYPTSSFGVFTKNWNSSGQQVDDSQSIYFATTGPTLIQIARDPEYDPSQGIENAPGPATVSLIDGNGNTIYTYDMATSSQLANLTVVIPSVSTPYHFEFSTILDKWLFEISGQTNCPTVGTCQ
jgi:peptidoglycan hydrolase-like protein with peptidoglycan-binding domain